MISFKEKVKLASSYINTNFFEVPSIGVIARGPSNIMSSDFYNHFSHCFLAGEFNSTLNTIGPFLIDKDVVLCLMQPSRYRTSPENCKKYNIQNIQISERGNTEKFNKIKLLYPDLKVVGYTNEHCQLSKKVFTYGNEGIYSTGIAAVFHALYFRPKYLYMIGLDFYNEEQSQYAVSESHDVVNKNSQQRCIKSMREGMIYNLHSMVRLFKDVNFKLFTTFKGVDGLTEENNFEVIQV